MTRRGTAYNRPHVEPFPVTNTAWGDRSCKGAVALLAIGLLSAAATPAPSTEAGAHQVPLVEGLTSMRATSVSGADYETVTTIGKLAPASFEVTISGEAPDDSGEVREITVSRTIRREDWRTAHTIRDYFHETDPSAFPGTTPDFSAAMVNDLRATGKTSVTYLDVEPEFGTTVVSHTMRGIISRVGPGPVGVTVLVNGRPTVLRAVHVRGRLADGSDGEDFDYLVLDDPDNPMVLKKTHGNKTSSVSKIEFPEPKSSATSLEGSLAKDKRALVYGIYFLYARADIRPVSEPTLREIATILKNNPDWRLNIVGHTDNVGGDASNLDLSRRRAQSVKAALVTRYGIAASRLTTGGFGASQPQEKNDTPEGRARNRRVELTRP